MSRLASAAKAHFYPIPPAVTTLIHPHLTAPDGGRLLDPCCGEGVALSQLAAALSIEPYGCELHQTRAELAGQTVTQLLATRAGSLPLQDRQQTRIFRSAMQQMRMSPAAFNLLYLNPPFDYDAEEGRLELLFLKQMRPKLCPSGVLVYVVPQRLLTHRPTAEYVASWFNDVRVLRFPDAEREFKQIVLFGVHNRRAMQPHPDTVAWLRGLGQAEDNLPVLGEEAGFTYTLPKRLLRGNKLLFLPEQLPTAQIAAEAATYGVTSSRAWADHLLPAAGDDGSSAEFHPLTPLRQGHLVNLIAAGYINNRLLQRTLPDGSIETVFIKGHTYKDNRVSRHIEPRPDDEGYTEITTASEYFQTDITILRPDGSVTSVTGDKLEVFLKTWLEPLTALLTKEYAPRYKFNLNGYAAVLDTLNQKRTIPNTNLRGLAPAQQHAVAALATRLDKRHLNQRDALLIGEMGTGKTVMAPAVAACIGARRVLVLCPPHLTKKWEREIRHVIPDVWVMQLKTITDVDAFFALPIRSTTGDPLSVFGIMKETSARSASGWRHAYHWCGAISQKPAVKGKKLDMLVQSGLLKAALAHYPTAGLAAANTMPELPSFVDFSIGSRDVQVSAEKLLRYVSQIRTPQCPTTGRMLTANDRPLVPSDLKGRKRFSSDNPLFCYSRRLAKEDKPLTLSGALRRQTTLQQQIRSGLRPSSTPAMPGYAKWPLATYIQLRYKRQIDLLVCDEVHEMKGHDSDRGYAFGRLAAASKKVLGLTGTIYGGKASTLFSLLFRTSHAMVQQYGHRDIARWSERYGIFQEVEKVHFGADGRQTANSRAHVTVKELPGASPAMVRWLLDRSVFVALADLGFALPTYSEEPVLLEMSPAMQLQYDHLAQQLTEELKQMLVRGDRSLLAAYLQALLCWPDSPWRPKVIRHPHTDKVVAAIPGLPQMPVGVAPKEAALLKDIQQEVSVGRNVLLLCQQTATLDITGQWVELLARHNIRAAVLRCDPSQREQWIAAQEAKGTQVIITHPRRVQTGLDILGFPSIRWIGIEYSVYTVKQANRRSYRIGQSQAVTVKFYAYTNTLQEHALQLIAAKLAATERVDGNTVATDSLADLDALSQGDIVSTLAKIVTGEKEKLSLQSLQDAFRHANAPVQEHLSLLGEYDEQASAVPDGVHHHGNGSAEYDPLTSEKAIPVLDSVPPALVAVNGNGNGIHLPSGKKEAQPEESNVEAPATLLELLRQHGATSGESHAI